MEVLVLAAGEQEARRFRHVPAHLEHRERGYRAERQQQAPDQIVRQAGGEQRGGKQRADDQSRRLHGEDQRDHHSAVFLPAYSLMIVALTG